MTPSTQDQDHLRLLSIFYYIWGGLTAAMSCFGFLYVLIGLGFAGASFAGNTSDTPPTWFGALLVGVGGIFVVLALAIGGLSIWTGRCLAQQRHYVFCLIIAGLSCLSVPLGTALGVFTFVVLMRPSVKELFQAKGRTPATA